MAPDSKGSVILADGIHSDDGMSRLSVRNGGERIIGDFLKNENLIAFSIPEILIFRNGITRQGDFVGKRGRKSGTEGMEDCKEISRV
jgi:hypothetical protein